MVNIIIYPKITLQIYTSIIFQYFQRKSQNIIELQIIWLLQCVIIGIIITIMVDHIYILNTYTAHITFIKVNLRFNLIDSNIFQSSFTKNTFFYKDLEVL